MNKIVNHTINGINETITCLLRVGSYEVIDKYPWVKVKDKIELHALFGLKYFRGLLWCKSTFDRYIIFTGQSLCF